MNFSPNSLEKIRKKGERNNFTKGINLEKPLAASTEFLFSTHRINQKHISLMSIRSSDSDREETLSNLERRNEIRLKFLDELTKKMDSMDKTELKTVLSSFIKEVRDKLSTQYNRKGDFE